MITAVPRHWALVLFIYIGVDFMDPSIPGVFFFDSDALFVDGVVQAKSNSATTNLAITEPMPFEGTAHRRDGSPAIQGRAVSRPARPQYLPRKNLKHEDSSSFTLPPDSSPNPALL